MGTGDFIPESLFYRLGMKANNETAQKFQAWLADEVIPTIRKTGGYINNTDMFISTYFDSIDESQKILVKNMMDNIEKKQQQIIEQATKIKLDEPLVELAKKRLDKNGVVKITDATKTFGLKKGKITTWAKAMGYLHKKNTEVNNLGDVYFKVYDNNGFPSIGITEQGLQLINNNIKDIA